MKILLTGGSGYIGSVVVRDLVKLGHEVSVFDNLERGHAANVPQGVRLIVGDLKDRVQTCDVFSDVRPDAVLHFAAYALVGESVSDPLLYYSNNVSGGLNLLEGMKASGCNRLIFSSSCATYGIPPKLPIEEDFVQVPVNPYGDSKLAFESACNWLWRAGKLKPTYLRYFNAAGAAYGLAERHEPETHIIPNVLKVAMGLSPAVRIYGSDYPTADGTCVRDYVHVKDLSAAHVLALEKESLGAYNLGTGHGVSVLEIVEMCRKVTGKSIPVEICPRRIGDPPALYASGTRARRELGWNAVHSDLRTIIGDAWSAMQGDGS